MSPVNLPSLSLDLSVNRTGVTPASEDGVVDIPPFNIINVGGHYRFHTSFDYPVSFLRVQVTNVTNVSVWNVGKQSRVLSIATARVSRLPDSRSGLFKRPLCRANLRPHARLFELPVDGVALIVIPVEGQ